MKYQYERNSDISSKERRIRWAYDELGIVPKGRTGKKLLIEYLVEKGVELPEDLKEV